MNLNEVRNRKNPKKIKLKDELNNDIIYESKIKTNNLEEINNTKINKQKNLEKSNNDIENKNNVLAEEANNENINKIDNLVNKEYNQFINKFKCVIEIDLLSLILFFVAFCMRAYNLDQPRNIIFDELYYGQYISLYLKRTFFFDSNPPLGKQLIAGLVYLTGFDGNVKFDKIGSPYAENMPLFFYRFIPNLCGSLLIPIIYNIVLNVGLKRPTAFIAALLILFDNALLTQSRFILMDTILLMFSMFGLLCILKYRHCRPLSLSWFICLTLSFISFTCALCVKFVGIYSYYLGLVIVLEKFSEYLSNLNYSDKFLKILINIKLLIVTVCTVTVYVLVFYVHLKMLNKAGPHDTIMTSAFQASLEGGLASITKGQPLYISHGSQITLRHTHGRTCWLHSHQHVYPVRYPDKRGSSHQQQVTCYSFKDVNNWWIIKRPEKDYLAVDEPDPIKHGDIIQIVHGITSRALNSHDVAAPMSPQCQEVSCYIDYNVSMPAQNLWRVEIINKNEFGDIWQTISSHVRLIHVNSSQALKFSGKQLPDWGFHQHEIVTDKNVEQEDTIWNVEEHRYTKSEDQKERERQMVSAEMIPTAPTKLSFWSKFIELHRKMLVVSSSSSSEQPHMYSSEPYEWPFLVRGIAYWVSKDSNAQIHLLGNILLWKSCLIALLVYSTLLIFYLLRRRRECYDIPSEMWDQFILNGKIFFVGYLIHYLPYFFVDRTLFLHHYLPAFIFNVLLLTSLIEHLFFLFRDVIKVKFFIEIFFICVILWICATFYVFQMFLSFSYGIKDLSIDEIVQLRWKDSWDFILHKN